MENHELVPDTVSPYPWGARQLSLLVRLRAAHQYTPYELSYYLNTVPQDVTRSFAPTGEVWPLHNQTQLDTDARFIMVAGSPFSGKSMVSALLQQTLQEGGRDALLVRSDVVRYKYLPPDIYTTHESRFGWRANTRTHMHLFADAWH